MKDLDLDNPDDDLVEETEEEIAQRKVGHLHEIAYISIHQR